MTRRFTSRCVLTGLAAAALVHPPVVWGLPASGPLTFITPTPSASSLVTTTTIQVQVEAGCALTESTLAVSLNGVALPQSSFLPFGPCTNSRKQSQIATVTVTLPNGAITGAPASLNAGQSGNFSGTTTGDGASWNFDGGAAPATGTSVSAIFNAGGAFTVRLRATKGQTLQVSGTDTAHLLSDQRVFNGGDATPDSRQLAVVTAPDLDFRNYEASHVHPLALNGARDRLYAVNTNEGRLSVFNVAGDGSLAFAGDVAVGVDPVSVAVRPTTNEVWVANHLSDTVSIVDGVARKLVATLPVGDEPNDVVFASGRAFVALGGKDNKVKAFDASTRAQVASLDIFSDDPRALAVNSGGSEVYAVPLESGNKSTALFTTLVGGGAPPPNPPRNPALGAAPGVGLIVKFNPANSRWEDEVGGNWSSKVNFSLPDQDVFVITATGTPSIARTVSGVGTILFDVAVNPATGLLWVTNTDARNLTRFEPNLRGHLVQTRISIVNSVSGAITFADLNSHINYGVTPGPPAEIQQSLAHPGQGAFNAAGTTYYVAAFGSGKVGVLNGSGVVTNRITVGGGPSGLALNESAARLYVMNRFDSTISVVNTGTNTQLGTVGVAGAATFDPSPDVIKNGRKFLYDGQLTSGHGDIACATCHVFSNLDHVAWDLGDPQGTFVPYSSAPWVTFAPLGPSKTGFDPQKGPMTTQTLRGLKTLEPFHWRGDRQNFQAFNPAFQNLMGTGAQLSSNDMNAFTNFINTVNFPPNPNHNVDDTMPASLTVPAQTGGGATASGNPNTGQTLFTSANPPLDANVFQCSTCHALPTGTTRNLFNGSNEGESQDFKIPQLRNMYTKIGFGVIRPNLQSNNATNIGLPTQKRGFGFLHDGSVSLTEFLAAPVFVSNTQQERDVFAFMIAFPTESAACIGAQQSVDSSNKNNSTVIATITALTAQANGAKCDVIVKGVVSGVTKGYVWDVATARFDPDTLAETPLAESNLRSAVGAGDLITYTGVPPGAGRRLGIDRDRDGFLDRDESAGGTDPASPNSNAWQF